MIAVRPATAADARAIAEIHVASWRATYRGLMPDELLASLSVEQREEFWRSTVESAARAGAERTWVATAGESLAICGFASTGPCRDEDVDVAVGVNVDVDVNSGKVAELYAIYLAPDAVGRGIGQALFACVVADLKARGGARELTLWVLEGNERAIRFYERCGMRADVRGVKTVRAVALPHVRYRMAL